MEEKEQYVITPKLLLYDNNITFLQRLIMIELLALSNQKGYAYCSNTRLAKLFEVSTVSISQNIKKLEQKGYISCAYEKEKSNSNRTITIKANFKGYKPSLIGKEEETNKPSFKHPLSQVKAPINLDLSTYKPSFKLNIKSNNKTNIKNNNKRNIKEKINVDDKVEILRNIFKEYYSDISSRFISKKVKDELSKKIKDFDDIEKGFKNFLEIKQKEKTEIKFIKSTHIFIKDEMYKDYQESKFDEEEKILKEDYEVIDIKEFLANG